MPTKTLFDPVECGRTIRFLRERRGWSQEYLGRLLGDALGGSEWDQPRVSAAENGTRAVKQVEVILALCQIFEVPPDYFFGPQFGRLRLDDELARMLETAPREKREAIKMLLATSAA